MQLRRRGFPRDLAIPASTPPLLGVLLCLALLGFWTADAALAQETQTAPQIPDAPSATQSSNVPLKDRPVALFVMLDKKSIVFPDIVTGSASMSTGQKFKLFVDNSISLHTLSVVALGSGLRQAADSPRGYGQGGDGYAKRFGSAMARETSGNFFETFVLATTLHQDPRFFPERNPTIGGSVKYSAQRLFVTRDDEGRDVTNWSGLVGPLLGEGLANAYWPEQDRSVAQTLERYGTDLASRFAGNIIRDYWPVLLRRVGGSARAPVRGN